MPYTFRDAIFKLLTAMFIVCALLPVESFVELNLIDR